jgi:hypothetical protein
VQVNSVVVGNERECGWTASGFRCQNNAIAVVDELEYSKPSLKMVLCSMSFGQTVSSYHSLLIFWGFQSVCITLASGYRGAFLNKFPHRGYEFDVLMRLSTNVTGNGFHQLCFSTQRSTVKQLRNMTPGLSI